MLMPKKVKYRKQQRGRRNGKAWRGGALAFGEYGLKALEPAWITDRQIEASRVAITRFIKRGGKLKLAAPLDEARDGHARGFNLSVRDPGGLERLEAVLAKRERASAPSLAVPAAALLL